jgi:hypothetical protein
MMLAGLSSSALAQQTIVAASRSIDWSKAGVSGGIPNRGAICASLDPGVTALQINAAIASCPSGQVVSLSAGTYNLAHGIMFDGQSGVTLRGAGPDATFLVFTGSADCTGKDAAICVIGSFPVDSPTNLASWTAGYAKGSTAITIGMVGGLGILPVVGTVITLDQVKDSTDTGDVFVCDASPACVRESNGFASSYIQQQLVTVTSITGDATCSSGCTVGISPGLYMPNWRSSQSPRAWWPGYSAATTLPISGVGIEDLSVDSSRATSAYGITFFGAANSWIRNVRSIRAATEPVLPTSYKHVLMFRSSRITIRDSYFFGRLGTDDYGLNQYWASDNLFENNIFQHIPSPMLDERSQGTVVAYNYSINNLWGEDGTWAQGSYGYHNSGICCTLHEGNDGHGVELENTFAATHFVTMFRNRMTGFENAQINQTVPGFVYALSRYISYIGNVLGTGGYHTQYQTAPGDPTTNCARSIYALGLGGNCADGGGAVPPNDTKVKTTLMRWGNWDVVTNGTRWDSTEVPSSLSPYGNPVPADQNLPPSFYLSAKPSFFVSDAWPPIGPDVTDGDLPNVGGHAHRIPARICFEDVMHGTYGDSSARMFNAANCYGGVPAPPTNLRIVR